MSPPPERLYSSQEELFSSIQAWAAEHRYAFRILRSKKLNKSSRVKITYCCDRAGRPPASLPCPTSGPRRQTASRRTGCLFSVFGIMTQDEVWELRQRPDMSVHNHSPSSSMAAHPGHRKLGEQAMTKIRDLYEGGLQPKQIQSVLVKEHENQSHNHVLRYDVNNFCARLRRERNQGLATNDALIKHLKDNNTYYRLRTTDENRVQNLFIAYDKSIQLARINLDVILIDNTYKTNKYSSTSVYILCHSPKYRLLM
jgi:hypothetical protein